MDLGEMDFDVTSSRSGISALSTTAKSLDVLPENMDDLIFDVTATHANETASEKPAVTSPDDGSLAFTLDFPTDFKAPEPVDIGLGDISLNLGGLASAAASSESKDDRWQEVATKLDLAKAYQEMGDAAGAKEILDEVLRDGDAEQRASAEAMMQQL
jgi:pilus assembly protein FimV